MTMLALTAAFLCALAVQAYAASNPVTAEIPVRVFVNGEAPDPAETYSIVLKPDDASYPVPSDAVNGEAVIEISGAGDSSFYIAYTHPGTYTYTVSQKAGTNEACGYDACVYEVTVYVTNSETEAGMLDVAVKAEKGDAYGVKSSIEFTNSYPETEPTEPASEAEPTEPASEAEPTEPVSEAEPTEPVSEEEPTEPVSEAEPTEPASEAEPTEPASEAEPTEPASEEEPTEPASEEEPTEPASEAEPTEPASETASTQSADTPQTGDETNLLLPFTIACASGVVLISLFFTRKKKKEGDAE